MSRLGFCQDLAITDPVWTHTLREMRLSSWRHQTGVGEIQFRNLMCKANWSFEGGVKGDFSFSHSRSPYLAHPWRFQAQADRAHHHFEDPAATAENSTATATAESFAATAEGEAATAKSQTPTAKGLSLIHI